jgi:putative ABC transport system permease protein
VVAPRGLRARSDSQRRVPGDPLGIARSTRRPVSKHPTQPIYNVETLQQAFSHSIARRRFNLYLLGTFAAASLLMAIVGIYGVIADSVMQRTCETWWSDRERRSRCPVS